MNNNELKILSEAYLTLLQIPYNSPVRLEIMESLAQLRENIAKITGSESQFVQDSFEFVALTMKAKL
jgi:hypothetical protein